MSIGTFCNRNVVTASRKASAAEAARLMREHHVGDVVMVHDEGGRPVPVGIVTDRDIAIGVVAAGVDPAALTLGELVLAPLVAVPEDMQYAEAIRVMRDNAVRLLPVVDATGALVGIVTLDDLVYQLVQPLAGLAEIAGSERRRESVARR
jgi:CBS domain-containing protein